MANQILSDKQIQALKVKYKSKGNVMAHSLKYLHDKDFFVNKQFDNKNYSVFTISESRKSQGLIALFKTKKSALEFAAEIGLTQVEPPKVPSFEYQNKLDVFRKDIIDKLKSLICTQGVASKYQSHIRVIKYGTEHRTIMLDTKNHNYLSEITPVELISHNGYTFSYDTLTIEELVTVVDSFL
jgi:hypothetical protein